MRGEGKGSKLYNRGRRRKEVLKKKEKKRSGFADQVKKRGGGLPASPRRLSYALPLSKPRKEKKKKERERLKTRKGKTCRLRTFRAQTKRKETISLVSAGTGKGKKKRGEKRGRGNLGGRTRVEKTHWPWCSPKERNSRKIHPPKLEKKKRGEVWGWGGRQRISFAIKREGQGWGVGGKGLSVQRSGPKRKEMKVFHEWGGRGRKKGRKKKGGSGLILRRSFLRKEKEGVEGGRGALFI